MEQFSKVTYSILSPLNKIIVFIGLCSMLYVAGVTHYSIMGKIEDPKYKKMQNRAVMISVTCAALYLVFAIIINMAKTHVDLVKCRKEMDILTGKVKPEEDKKEENE